MLGKIKDSAAYISRFLEGEKYRIGIILGTGLGELGKSIEIKHTIPYAGIPHFPVSTVQGHKGNLLIVCQPDDSGTISIGHAGEAGPELVDVFPSQRMFREEIDMVGDDHQVAHQKLSVDTTGSIGNEEILHA